MCMFVYHKMIFFLTHFFNINKSTRYFLMKTLRFTRSENHIKINHHCLICHQLYSLCLFLFFESGKKYNFFRITYCCMNYPKIIFLKINQKGKIYDKELYFNNKK